MRTLLCLALLVPASALAQDSIDAHGLFLAPTTGDVRDPLVTRRPSALEPGAVYGGAFAEYVHAPLTRVVQHADGSLSHEAALRHLATLDLHGGVAVHERLRLEAALPIHGYAAGTAGGGPVLGDLRLAAPILLADGLGVVPHLDVPLGDGDRHLGRAGFGGGLLAVASVETGPLTLTANAGPQFNQRVALENIGGSDRVDAAFAVGVAPSAAWGLTLESRNSLSLGGEAPTSELLLSTRHHSASGTGLTVGAALGLNQAPGVPAYRVFLGGSFGSPRGGAAVVAVEPAPVAAEPPVPVVEPVVEAPAPEPPPLVRPDQRIEFAFDSARLLPAWTPALEEVAAQLEGDPRLSLEVAGHTDSVGTPEVNLVVGQGRADAVRDWLIAAGIAPERLVARSYGETAPIADNATRAGRQANRRVEFQLLER